RMARDACGAVDMRGSDESKPSMNHRNTVKRYRSPKKLKRLPCPLTPAPLPLFAGNVIGIPQAFEKGGSRNAILFSV
ncbi:hypothetical protein, partial [Rhizobium leguminosarum]|uniref:hypothetical protein n=1 Tax=Rhizobium leguminosarum TaxID=384 RepID=UPI001C95FFAC